MLAKLLDVAISRGPSFPASKISLARCCQSLPILENLSATEFLEITSPNLLLYHYSHSHQPLLDLVSDGHRNNLAVSAFN